MDVLIRKYEDKDLKDMVEIWNEVVEDGVAFPQINSLSSVEEGKEFFASQSFTAVAEVQGKVLGLYILHPNNVGRCGHIANSSYAVKSSSRGMKIGENLVKHSLEMGKELGFRILQFNAVVKSNIGAINLYEKLGFEYRGKQNLFAENTGWTDFLYYELLLEEKVRLRHQ